MSSTSLSRTRSRRRLILAACYGAVAMGIGVALAATPGGAARGPATAGASKAAAEAQFQKAKALYDQEKYAEAQVENDKALALDPSYDDALYLKRALAAKIAEGGGGGGGPVGGPGVAAGGGGKLPLLNAQQVSLIRLAELGPDDARITGKVDPKVLEDFWQNVIAKDPQANTSNAAHNAFIQPQNFPLQARRIQMQNELKYMEGVSVTSDPAVITAFRGNVVNAHNYVLQSCGAAECHGGGKGGNFRIVSPATSPEQIYTNYYILMMYSNGSGKMIDRSAPDDSLLLQYGLPWATAKIKHPKVDTHKLTGPTDARFVKISEWIRELGLTRPSYHVNYEVPGMNAGAATTTAPGSAPATGAAPATNRGK